MAKWSVAGTRPQRRSSDVYWREKRPWAGQRRRPRLGDTSRVEGREVTAEASETVVHNLGSPPAGQGRDDGRRELMLVPITVERRLSGFLGILTTA